MGAPNGRATGLDWRGQYERTAAWTVLFAVLFLLLSGQPLILRTIAATSTASLLYVLLTWQAYRQLTGPQLHRWANAAAPPLLRQYPWLDFWVLGGRTGLSFVLFASFFGLIIAGLFLPLAGELNFPLWQEKLFVALCVLTVACSWLMAHLAYALHYSWLYYHQSGAGLEFPGDEPLDLLDFVYFAFTVGTTAASSDVNVTSQAVRRVVTGHTLFSFVFNTAILALTLQFAVA
ncbi:MAG: DUF1345 domain-containing protein [Deinococcus sp.]|nr:DUF1345 domain-containing protein [Deinococcus sp.]